MDCSNCAQSITRYLQRKGLEDVFVNFQTKEVRFRPDDHKISLAEVKKGIHKLGYSVVEEEQKPPFWTTERKLIISTIFTLPLLIYHFVMMAGMHWSVLENPWVQLILCLPVFAIGVAHFGVSAFKSLRSGVPNMDVLIFTGSTAAFIYSLIGTFLQNPDYIFYETSATIITLVLVGNWLEKRAVAQTTSAIGELGKLQVEKANRILPSGTVVSLSKDEIKRGDLLKVNEGDKIPTDGKIIEGEVQIDESMLTGESDPVLKRAGDSVIGASLVIQGNCKMEVTAVGKDTVLDRMIELVKTAQEDKPDIQRLADRISAIFVPAVLAISLLTFLGSYFVFQIGFQQALMNSIAVLVISCPCAMGLATPTAVMVGVGRLARNGILIKGGQTLEVLAGIRNIIFDKTGTLTTGAFKIRDIEYFTPEESKVNALVYQMEQHSSHPIAKSLLQQMESRLNGYQPGKLTVEEAKGRGVLAHDEMGNTFKLGSASWTLQEQDENALVLTENDQLLAKIQIGDDLKPEAAAAIQHLKSKNIKPIILSGDRREKTQKVAETLGIETYYAEQLPEQKLTIVEGLSSEAPTAMVGDGINDAPALARANLGISLSNASATAIQSAQVVLLNGQLDYLTKALNISEATVLTIKQNLFWAFAYNIVAIPIAAAGFLNPMWGALFMAFSDVVVIGNSIRLKFKKIR